ncbi:hypothetical protein LDENG_00007340, partial [Lucifuga dentata]
EFYWYRQYPGDAPQLLISHLGSGTLSREVDPNSGLSVEVSEDQRQISMKLPSPAASDSAVYYCAVRPTVTAKPQSVYKNTQLEVTFNLQQRASSSGSSSSVAAVCLSILS